MVHVDVCVVGEINPDLILYGLPKDLQPERIHDPGISSHVGKFLRDFRAQSIRARHACGHCLEDRPGRVGQDGTGLAFQGR